MDILGNGFNDSGDGVIIMVMEGVFLDRRNIYLIICFGVSVPAQVLENSRVSLRR